MSSSVFPSVWPLNDLYFTFTFKYQLFAVCTIIQNVGTLFCLLHLHWVCLLLHSVFFHLPSLHAGLALFPFSSSLSVNRSFLLFVQCQWPLGGISIWNMEGRLKAGGCTFWLTFLSSPLLLHSAFPTVFYCHVVTSLPLSSALSPVSLRIISLLFPHLPFTFTSFLLCWFSYFTPV